MKHYTAVSGAAVAGAFIFQGAETMLMVPFLGESWWWLPVGAFFLLCGVAQLRSYGKIAALDVEIGRIEGKIAVWEEVEKRQDELARALKEADRSDRPWLN